MGHHLIFLLQELSQEELPSYSDSAPTTLLAFDLRDHSIQEVTLDEEMFDSAQESVYFKYKDNQIIRYGGFSDLMRITIESFSRILFMISESHPILQLSQRPVRSSMWT